MNIMENVDIIIENDMDDIMNIKIDLLIKKIKNLEKMLIKIQNKKSKSNI